MGNSGLVIWVEFENVGLLRSTLSPGGEQPRPLSVPQAVAVKLDGALVEVAPPRPLWLLQPAPVNAAASPRPSSDACRNFERDRRIIRGTLEGRR